MRLRCTLCHLSSAMPCGKVAMCCCLQPSMCTGGAWELVAVRQRVAVRDARDRSHRGA